MDQILKCPSHIELLQLNNGQIEGDRSELLFNHIETCEVCSSIYGNLKDRPDNFVRKLAHVTEEDRTKARQAIKRHRLLYHAGLPCEQGAICLTRLKVGNLAENQGPGASSQFDLVEMGILPLECGLFE